jgi:hypothetical protein
MKIFQAFGDQEGLSQWVSGSVGQWVSGSVGQWVSRSVGQWVSESVVALEHGCMDAWMQLDL